MKKNTWFDIGPGSITEEMSKQENPIDLITLNIRGRIFEVDKFCLSRNPDCKLSKLRESDESYIRERGCYYFNRNPVVFECVVDYLVTGRLHVPTCLCMEAVQEEMAFWGVDQNTVLGDCCWVRYKEQQEDESSLDEVHSKWKQEVRERQQKKSCCQNMWIFLNDVHSSTAAAVSR